MTAPASPAAGVQCKRNGAKCGAGHHPDLTLGASRGFVDLTADGGSPAFGHALRVAPCHNALVVITCHRHSEHRVDRQQQTRHEVASPPFFAPVGFIRQAGAVATESSAGPPVGLRP